MKKKITKIFAFIAMIILLSACGEKKVLKTEDMVSKLSNNGFIVTDVTKQMEDPSVTYVASANNGKFQIEYYVFETKKQAKAAYTNNKKSFETNKTKGKETSGDTYNKYVQELSDTYNVITRVDNTLLYASVNIEYKGTLKNVFKDLGY